MRVANKSKRADRPLTTHNSQLTTELITIGDGSKVRASELSYIARDLWPLVVPIDSLTIHDRNVRLHGDQNLESIKNSLLTNGFNSPVTVDVDNVIRSGNGRCQVARSLGWKYLPRVRTDFTGAKALAWAIADNRTAELAEWDAEELQAQLREISDADLDIDLDSLGFDEDEIEALLEGDAETAHGFSNVEKQPKSEVKKPKEVFQIILTFETEDEQTKWLEKLNDVDGLKVRAINT